MLRGRQQKTSPVLRNDVPVIQTNAVVVDKLEAAVIDTISTGFWKSGKRINDLAGIIDRSLVGKTPPFETAGPQFNPVTFIRDARRLVETFVARTGSERKHRDNQYSAKSAHASGESFANAGLARKRYCTAIRWRTRSR